MLKPFIEELVNELASPNHPDAWEVNAFHFIV